MVHLNITLEDELYQRLKERTAPKKLSAFIAEAVRAKLGPSREELESAYQRAAREPWRAALAREWVKTEVEEWPA
jgi:hypothetical protein